MNELQKRLQNVPGGERRRREAASQWVSEVGEILLSLSPEEWGRMFLTETVEIARMGAEYGGEETHVYFRRTEEGGVPVGFSYIIDDNIPENIRDNKFWCALGHILRWLSQVVGWMDVKSKSRDVLLKMIE